MKQLVTRLAIAFTLFTAAVVITAVAGTSAAYACARAAEDREADVRRAALRDPYAPPPEAAPRIHSVKFLKDGRAQVVFLYSFPERDPADRTYVRVLWLTEQDGAWKVTGHGYDVPVKFLFLFDRDDD